MSSGRRDVSLLHRALRYERDTREVCSIVGFCACVRVVVNPPKPKKIPIFFLPPLFFRQILSHWGRLSKLRFIAQNKTETYTICLFDCQILFCKRTGTVGVNAIK